MRAEKVTRNWKEFPVEVHPPMKKSSTKNKKLKVLHKEIAEDKENLTSLQKQNKELLLQIEFMKLTADQERDKLAAQKNIFRSNGWKTGTECSFAVKASQIADDGEHFQSSNMKGLLSSRTRTSIQEFLKGDLLVPHTGKSQDIVPSQAHELTTQWPGNKQDGRSAEEEQLQVARELVKKNRQIFELEQVGYHSNTHHVHKTHKNTFYTAPAHGGF
ncbi:hypothetical protein OS493_026217 [Desmophyllum pertusum]|uniref:Uncharacterized protein n=1 Tax=Desmophyllum pertusum TaxID=174260 RepID=A0A9W9ZL91_9CNID|nr:hypothetical protein OS493_026217 [Desmophyllum pertusum]